MQCKVPPTRGRPSAIAEPLVLILATPRSFAASFQSVMCL